jgi:hypothetical protein
MVLPVKGDTSLLVTGVVTLRQLSENWQQFAGFVGISVGSQIINKTN